MEKVKEIKGNIVDVLYGRIFFGSLRIKDGCILSVTEEDKKGERDESVYIMPGFIDAHIHIESSMLPPHEFARMAMPHGTIATVSDPHEIANVCGIPGIEYMISHASHSPLVTAWGAPSCVPATTSETSGAHLGVGDVSHLLDRADISYLSEVMNYPGVINRDTEVMGKIAAAIEQKKPVDGHAPGLTGEDLKNYISAGISTDHESFLLKEALEKISLGMKIIIREGSAAKNFDALHPLLKEHWKMCMFGSDDKHPNDLVHGHINQIVSRAVARGYDPMHVLYCACIHPITHYGLPVGYLQAGHPADFIVVKDLRSFDVVQTVRKGEVVAKQGKALFDPISIPSINIFEAIKTKVSDFRILVRDPALSGGVQVQVIEAKDGQLITGRNVARLSVSDGNVLPDVSQDIIKIAVVCRYPTRDINKGQSLPRKGLSFSERAGIGLGFIKGFGLKEGAIASTVAHDSHNIVAVGTSDECICRAVNLLIEEKGGISAVGPSIEEVLPLPIAGLMSDQDGHVVAHSYTRIDQLAKELGSSLSSPFMTLSFMALPVIPSLKMTDKGLFDTDVFHHVPLFSDDHESL